MRGGIDMTYTITIKARLHGTDEIWFVPPPYDNLPNNQTAGDAIIQAVMAMQELTDLGYDQEITIKTTDD